MNAIQKNAHENSLLDLLKLIFAFFVVAVHSTPTSTPFGAAVSHAVHMGVPVFFLISGYLFRAADGCVKDDHVRRRILRLTKLTVLWLIIYFFASTAVVYFERGKVPGALSLREWAKLITSPQTVINFLLYQFMPGIGYHLWYLPAQIIAYLALWGIHKLNWQKARLPIACALTGLQMLIQLVCVFSGTPLDVLLVRNAWVMAIPMLLLGDWLHDHESISDRLPTAALIAASILGLIMPAFEFWWGSYAEFYVGNYLSAIAVFLLSIKLGRGYVRPWGRWMRDASLTVYLWHMLFVHSLSTAIIYIFRLPPIFQWFIAPLSFGLSLGVFELQRRWKAARK